MRIERARIEDLFAILAVERNTPDAPHWAEQAYRVALEGGREGLQRCVFAAWLDDELVGFAAGSVVAGTAELESVAVQASARRQGLGKALCAAVIAWEWAQAAETVELEVRERSTGARALYMELGFKECGRRPAYYRNPVDDAVLMRLVR